MVGISPLVVLDSLQDLKILVTEGMHLDLSM